MQSYLSLEKQFSRLNALSHASSILGWDEAVMMPQGGGDARALAMAEINVLRHETLTSTQIFDLLQKAEEESKDLHPWQKANLREMKLTIFNARAVTKELVETASLTNTRCEQAWRILRAENNWNDFLPLFEKVVDLARTEAALRADYTGLAPYDCLLQQYSPGLTSAEVTATFDQVKSFLPALIQNVLERQKSLLALEPKVEIPIENQKNLGLEVMKVLGFNFNQGRLDISHHPFCGGVPQDVRITTRYNTANFIESLMGVIHETGHACYDQGLPQEWASQPVGGSRGMQIHESQSLLFELCIGRSKSFLEFLHPLILKHLAPAATGPEWTPLNMYRLFNKVEASYIRVNADEVTYPAHVILRYEIERDLITRKIEAKDIPEIWNQKMQAYLGLSTDGNYKNGCMQDSHWPGGAFGYFPAYSLGAMTATQLFAKLQKTFPNLDEQIKKGDLSAVHQWLKGHIWSQGCFSSTNELLIHATGEVLNPTYFKKYIENKYLSEIPEGGNH